MNAVLNSFDRVAKRYGSVIKVVPYDNRYLDQSVQIMEEIHAHSVYRHMPLDRQKVIRQLSASGSVVPDRYFRLAVRGERVMGGFYGLIFKPFFCDQLVAKDMGWWVPNTARGSAAAILLLRDFEQWAQSRGAVMVGLGQAGVERIEETRALFQHCGYRLCGYNTVKDFPHG